MKDVVEKILREEARASKILQDAKAESERITRDARKEKENIIIRAIAEADELGCKNIQASERKFILEKENVLQEAKKEILAIKEAENKNASDISKKVFHRIITIEG